MEVTKWLKPSECVSRIGGSASVQAATRVNAEQSSKRTMRRSTRQPYRGRLIRLDEMSETITLFAALEVATGKIIATHLKRRRRVEFLDFMNSVTAVFPNQKLLVILDNLNTHMKNEDWLKAHPNVKFHFTPTARPG